MSRMRRFLLISLCISLTGISGCATLRDKIPFMGKKDILVGGVYRQNFDPDRVVDLIIVKKITGEKRLGMFTKYKPFLEGYLRGVVVDYDDTPIQGVVVRVMDGTKDYAGFDPGVSDADGIYKVRFSIPIVKDKVDIKATMSYNPPWQQQMEMLGASLEPQTKETKFRFYFNRDDGIVGIGEDAPKTIVRKSSGDPNAPAKPGARGPSGSGAQKSYAPPPPQRPAPPKATKKGDDDMFGGFGDFGN